MMCAGVLCCNSDRGESEERCSVACAMVKVNPLSTLRYAVARFRLRNRTS